MSKRLKVINGQSADIKPVKTTLEQVWGGDGTSRYGTLDESEYTNKIKTLNKVDLYREAIKNGLMPSENRSQLEKKLIKAFVEHKRKYVAMPAPIQPKQISEQARRILAEGKS